MTYLAAFSFSDNSSIEENTRRGSLKPHTTAELFGGLLNFSTSREDWPSPGTSRRLSIQRRTVIQVHLYCGTTFPHSLRFRYRRPGGDVRRESQIFSEEPVFLMPSGVRLGTAEAGGQARRVARTISRRNHFSSFPSGLDWRRGKPGGHACGVGTLFSGRNHFSSFPWGSRSAGR